MLLTNTFFASTTQYRGRVNDAPELEWCLKQDDDSYFKIALAEISKKGSIFEKIVKDGFKLELKVYQDMFDVVRWLQSNRKLFLRFMLNFFKRRNKNLFPSTLVHGDLRSENMLLPQTHMKEFMVYDFQCIKETSGMLDVAYHIGSSMSVKHRRLHERELLIHYYNVMRQRGVTDLTFAEILLMYQFWNVWLVMVSVFGIGSTKNEKDKSKIDEKSAKVGLAFITRSNAVCKDWNVLAALRMWSQKIHDDDTIDRLTRKEQIEILPNEFHDLLNRDDEAPATPSPGEPSPGSGSSTRDNEENLVGVKSRRRNMCIIS